MTERRRLKNKLSKLKSLQKYFWHCEGMMDVLGGRPVETTKEQLQKDYDKIGVQIIELENKIKEIDNGKS